MGTAFSFPNKKAVIYWPVGTGDSSTLILKPGKLVMQIDLHHLELADDDDNPEWPIIDYLVRNLPKKPNGRPYLALFVLTHPDEDHIRGFEELLRRVDIGEIWHTPKIFRDQSDQDSLCSDAKAFRKEAHRRRTAIADNPNDIRSGNRLRVIGHDDILNEPDYKKLPANCKSRSGEKVNAVDGNDLSDFTAFIHAPFSADQAKNKNNTSLALNVVIWEGEKAGQFFFFGDREYPTVKRIFEETERSRTNTPYLYWDALLSPHHCSKGVMYWKEEGDEEESFKQDVMDYMAKYSKSKNGYIVASSTSEFTSAPGDNPPHSKARRQYEKIVKPGRFICTHEYPTKAKPVPIVFTVGENGFEFDDKRSASKGPATLASVVASARGVSAPPPVQTTFGGTE